MTMEEVFSSILNPNAQAPFKLDSNTIYAPQLTLYDSNDQVLGSSGDGFVEINTDGKLQMTLTDVTKQKLSHKYYLEATFAPILEETPFSPLIHLSNAIFSPEGYEDNYKPDNCITIEI